MQHLAQGDETIEIAGTRRRDKIGRMASALEVFRSHAFETRRLAEASQKERQRADAEKHAALITMAETIETETVNAMQQIGVRGTDMVATADERHASSTRTDSSVRLASTAAEHVLVNA